MSLHKQTVTACSVQRTGSEFHLEDHEDVDGKHRLQKKCRLVLQTFVKNKSESCRCNMIDKFERKKGLGLGR